MGGRLGDGRLTNGWTGLVVTGLPEQSSRQFSSYPYQTREAVGDFVPKVLAELTAEDAIAPCREARDRSGSRDSSGWPVDLPCTEPYPPLRTISCGVTRDTCYVIYHHEVMMKTLISAWSRVQTSLFAPDHALRVAVCRTTRKSAPSCGRSSGKTADRKVVRVFPRIGLPTYPRVPNRPVPTLYRNGAVFGSETVANFRISTASTNFSGLGASLTLPSVRADPVSSSRKSGFVAPSGGRSHVEARFLRASRPRPQRVRQASLPKRPATQTDQMRSPYEGRSPSTRDPQASQLWILTPRSGTQ